MNEAKTVTISLKALLAAAGVVIVVLVAVIFVLLIGNDDAGDASPDVVSDATDSDVENPGSISQTQEDLRVFVCGSIEGGETIPELAQTIGAESSEQCTTPDGELPAIYSVFENSTVLETYLQSGRACERDLVTVAGENWLVQTLDNRMAAQLQTDGGGVQVC